jgi:hypothetical protein
MLGFVSFNSLLGRLVDSCRHRTPPLQTPPQHEEDVHHDHEGDEGECAGDNEGGTNAYPCTCDGLESIGTIEQAEECYEERKSAPAPCDMYRLQPQDS